MAEMAAGGNVSFSDRLQRYFFLFDDAPAFVRYGVAIAAGLLADALRLSMTPLWGNDFPYIFAYPAALLSALVGGLLPGMITALVCATGLAFFLPPFDTAAGVLGQALFMLTISMIIWVAAEHRTATQRLAQQAAELRRTVSYTRSLIEASIDPIMTISADGKVMDVNQATVQATGVPRDTLIGSDVGGRFTEPDKARLGYLTALETGAVRDYPLTLRHASGALTEVLCNARVFPDETGKPAGVFAAARDITERKRAETEIRALNQELTRRVAALERANRELESFSYSVSHDLRTPLRAIDGFIALLLEEYKEQIDENGRGHLEVVRHSVARMGGLIDGLLEYIGLLNMEMRPGIVDMTAVAQDVSQRLLLTEPHRKIDIRIGDLPPVCADQAMIARVLDCLLRNAFKFTMRREDAVVEVGTVPGEDETTYYVKDNGAGFDMRYADKLFGVFLRLHSNDEFDGAGVGLAIVKRIIDRHHGRVWAEGAVGAGATFYFALPSMTSPRSVCNSGRNRCETA